MVVTVGPADEGDDDLALFSMVYRIPNAAEASWFDPILVLDNPVFVDPFLLAICNEPEFAGASDELFNHFRVLFEALAENPVAPIDRYLRFPEFREACLGYTRKGVDGSGSGRDRRDRPPCRLPAET